jgi:lipopolysaccharide/colanic/teichoic acid biosynthesis glycosyltransferase
MSKRLTDIAIAALALIVTLPLLMVAALAIRLHDRGPAFYHAPRIGIGGRPFRMMKLRTMVVDAGRLGAASTAASDARITPLGHPLRRAKLDELPQLWNVLRGDMSLVGPRPNSWRGGVERYTAAEWQLLDVRPGITDLASIVFSDEGAILNGAPDPDALYDQVIRPWKSRLGLLYVRHRSVVVDMRLIGLTAIAMIDKRRALAGIDRILARWGAAPSLRAVCRRIAPLPPGAPPEPGW